MDKGLVDRSLMDKTLLVKFGVFEFLRRTIVTYGEPEIYVVEK